MAKIKNPLLSLGAIGRLTKAITFKHKHKTNIVEITPFPPDAKSLAQLSWRTMYQKAIALWHALSPAEKEDWESQARRRHMTGYAWFLSQALKPNPGLYLPLTGGVMSGDIDMAANRILDIIDPVLAQEPVTKQYFEDHLPAGGYTKGAHVYHNANQTITTGVNTILAFNSERYDTDTIHNNITNNSRLTCKTAGKYILIAVIRWAGNATSTRSILLRHNGSLLIGVHSMQGFTGDDNSEIAATIYDLAINDYVEVRARQNSGGNLNVNSQNAITPEFMMQRIG